MRRHYATKVQSPPPHPHPPTRSCWAPPFCGGLKFLLAYGLRYTFWTAPPRVCSTSSELHGGLEHTTFGLAFGSPPPPSTGPKTFSEVVVYYGLRLLYPPLLRMG